MSSPLSFSRIPSAVFISSPFSSSCAMAFENVVNRLYSKTVPKKVQEYLRKSAEIKTDSKKKTEQVNE